MGIHQPQQESLGYPDMNAKISEAVPTPATTGGGPRLLKVMAVWVLAIAIIHLFWMVCDYSHCFQDGEVLSQWAGKVLMQGKGFSVSDFKNAWDSRGMDGDMRPRFLSYLTAIWTIKLRVILWDFVPPHPSFSLTWLFSLILAPWLLYRFLRSELACRSAAMLGVGLYMISAGYLSSATMLFHPGKPLASVAIILTLYMSMRAERHIKAGLWPIETPRFSKPMLLFLVCVLPIMLLTDETALFSLAIIPVWNYRFFTPRRFDWPGIRPCLLNAMLYSIPLLLYLSIAFIVAPLLCNSFFGYTFDFGSYLSRTQDVSKFDGLHLLQHLTTLFTAALAPWSAIRIGMPIAETPRYNITLLLLFLAAFTYLSYAVFQQRKFRKSYAKAGILMVIFLIFQTFVAARHPLNLVVSGYYYGAIFSILLAILLSCGLGSAFWNIKSRWLAATMVFYLLFIQIYNFSLLNSSWISHNNHKNMGGFAQLTYNPYLAYVDPSEIIKLYMNKKDPMSVKYADDIPAPLRRHRFAWVLELWRNRNSGYRDCLRERPLALGDLWLLTELYYRRTPAHIPVKGTLTPLNDQMAIYYLGALLRAHQGQPDEEPVPVLSFGAIPRGQFSPVCFDIKLGYPWILQGMKDGVQGLRNLGYTHFLMPVSGTQYRPGTFWNFHNEYLNAMAANTLSEYGIEAIGQVSVAGQEITLMKIVQ